MALKKTFRGPTDHINIRSSHSGCKAQYRGDTRNHFCRILVFMCPFGVLTIGARQNSGKLRGAGWWPCRPPEGFTVLGGSKKGGFTVPSMEGPVFWRLPKIRAPLREPAIEMMIA